MLFIVIHQALGSCSVLPSPPAGRIMEGPDRQSVAATVASIVMGSVQTSRASQALVAGQNPVDPIARGPVGRED
jgi:hypothetical protein